MISCTEFIAAYSELFRFLDDKYGRAEVDKLWEFLFAPTGKGIPLINFVKRDGIKGCVDYWSGTLTEESADVTFIYNLKDGWLYKEMHHCPSKGRLLALKETHGIEPYRDYCDHCDYYRAALEKEGLTWIRNHLAVGEAGCSSLIWDPKVFDGVMRMNENTVTKEFHSSENEYFHPDFHSSMNMGIEYVGKTHGEEDVKAYFRTFALSVYKKVIADIKGRSLDALKDFIQKTYKAEKAPDALAVSLSDDTLTVSVAFCPAVRHLRSTGREVSRWFSLSTSSVMEALANAAGLSFVMEAYNEETGAAKYSFSKK